MTLPADSQPLLDVRNLRVGLPVEDTVRYLVDDVSFRIERGETLGLVGESGCGKSTTGLALMQLTPKASRSHTRGQVLFEGRDVLSMSEPELRAMRGREISMVLQDPMTSLNPVLTVGDQLQEALHRHGDASGAVMSQQVVDALARVRVSAPESRVHAWPHQLSGGMKQRVVGAIALACRPRLLIADEPTTSLDVTLQAQYLSLLKSLQRDSGMSMLFITHDFGVVARMCSRVCVMYAGQIVEMADVRTLFRAPVHWYTAALIGSVPKLGRKIERLTAIAGAPPRMDAMPQGCRFASRCPNVQARCRAEAPPMTEIALGHEARCWYPRNVQPSLA
jgi:peptide/nickel transport system ATP-binding protein